MFSEELKHYLESRTDEHTCWARENSEQILADLNDAGIQSDSALAVLYTRYGWSIETQASRYELLDPEDMPSWTEYSQEELGVSENFIALTSIEGEGITLLDRDSGKVFDVEYGQFDRLANGELKPLAESQLEFIEWYFSERE